MLGGLYQGTGASAENEDRGLAGPGHLSLLVLESWPPVFRVSGVARRAWLGVLCTDTRNNSRQSTTVGRAIRESRMPVRLAIPAGQAPVICWNHCDSIKILLLCELEHLKLNTGYQVFQAY